MQPEAVVGGDSPVGHALYFRLNEWRNLYEGPGWRQRCTGRVAFWKHSNGGTG
jgi:hypothetical protein